MLDEERTFIFERLNRIDRRIKIIGRFAILAETVAGGWLFYRIAIDLAGASDGLALMVGGAIGLLIGAVSQREFDL